MSSKGLLHDRDWMIVTETGIAMSQKREPKLCLLKPSIDLKSQTLTLEFPGIIICLVAHLQSILWLVY